MGRIFIVDDQPGAKKRVSKALSGAGCRISATGDAASALDLIRKQPPELVLLGSLSERFDSFKLLMEIKREHPQLPVLAYAVKSDDAMNRLREKIIGLLDENRWTESEKQTRN